MLRCSLHCHLVIYTHLLSDVMATIAEVTLTLANPPTNAQLAPSAKLAGETPAYILTGRNAPTEEAACRMNGLGRNIWITAAVVTYKPLAVTREKRTPLCFGDKMQFM